MNKELRSNEKIDHDIQSAGQSFLGIHMSDMLCRISELDERLAKNILIQEYYANQIGFFDKDSSGTRVRVNAALRIIKAEQVLYALGKIDGTDPRVDLSAVENAKTTIRKIKNGELKLPALY